MPVKQKLSDAFAAIKSRWDANKQAIRQHLREFILDAARARIAGQELELRDIEADTLMNLLEAHELTPEDFELNVAAMVDRMRLAELAAQEDAARTESARLDRELSEFDTRVAEEHRANLKQLEELRLAAERASRHYIETVGAKSRLGAGGVASDAEQAVTAERAELLAGISRLRDMLSPHAFAGGNLMPSLGLNPASYVLRLKRELADHQKQPLPVAERISDLKTKIAAGEKAVAAAQKQLAALEKRDAALQARQVELAQSRYAVESFELVRPQLSRDEQMKRLAAARGFANV
jgi:hypothetical protein